FSHIYLSYLHSNHLFLLLFILLLFSFFIFSFLFFLCFFFFNDTATTEIYTLSLHDVLPIFLVPLQHAGPHADLESAGADAAPHGDRKSTRLNSSHGSISYAVFCLKKKKNSIIYN